MAEYTLGRSSSSDAGLQHLRTLSARLLRGKPCVAHTSTRVRRTVRASLYTAIQDTSQMCRRTSMCRPISSHTHLRELDHHTVYADKGPVSGMSPSPGVHSTNTRTHTQPPCPCPKQYQTSLLCTGGLRMDPASAGLWAALGTAHPEAATREYCMSRALTLDPLAAPTWAALGRLYAEQASDRPLAAQVRLHGASPALVDTACWLLLHCWADLPPAGVWYLPRQMRDVTEMQ